jgi:hypothetical protein
MRRMRGLMAAAAILTLAVGGPLHASTIAWAMGSPHAGGGPGSIVLSGTLALDSGWTTDGSATVKCWPAGGGLVTEFPETLTINNGSWGPVTVTGLTSNQTYNVTISIKIKKGTSTKDLTIDPAQATPH